MSFHRLNKNIGNAVLAKYEYQCTQCGSTENLCVHHIIRKKPADADYNEKDNLTVLCRSCHMKLHRREGHIIPPLNPPPINKNGRRGKNKEIVYCSIEGCLNVQHGKGLCKKHYARKFRKAQNW